MGIHMITPNYEMVIKPKFTTVALQALNALAFRSPGSSDYATEHEGVGTVLDSEFPLEVGQNFSTPPDTYIIYRGGLVFDLSSIPSSKTIVSGKVRGWGWGDYSDTDVIIRLVNGDALADVFVDEDYQELLSAITIMGYINTGIFVVDDWNELPLIADGIAAVQAGLATGRVRFGIRSSRDMSNYPPDGGEGIQFVSINCLGYPPPYPSYNTQLVVTYK